MKILICISNVPDTTTRIKPAADSKSIDTSGIQWIINPWDELALTRALEIQEASAGLITQVDVIGVGDAGIEPTLRKALAIGASQAFRVDAAAADAYSVAGQLATAIQGKEYAAIFCGIESSDFNSGAVGGMLAELIGYQSVAGVSGLDFQSGKWEVKKEIDGGNQQLSCSSPVVFVVQKGIAFDPRIPSMRGIMQSRTKPFNVIPGAAIDALVEYEQFELPAPKPPCKMVAEDQAGEIIKLLQNEAKVL